MPDLACTVFDGFPEAMVLLHNGHVAYYNPAAAAIFDAIAVDGAVPPSLEDITDGFVTVGGQLYSCAETPTQGDTLLTLRPVADQAEYNLATHLPQMLQHLREHVNNLMAVTHLAAPTLLDQGNEQSEHYLAVMNQSFYRILRVLGNAQLSSSLNEGECPFHITTLDLAEMCQDTATQVGFLARAVGVKFHYESPLTTLVTQGDLALTQHLILSLISNAVSAAGKGGEAGLRLMQGGKHARLTVWDSGPGLPSPEQIAERANHPSFEGLGLGLATARQIAALHGGAVMLESQPGRGVRATVSLPIQRPEPGVVHTPPPFDMSGGFDPIIVELSEGLPARVFNWDDLE